MKKNSFYKIGAGLLAGIAAGLYLNSESGKRFRREIGSKLEESKTDLKQKLSDKTSKASHFLQEKIGEVKTNMNKVFEMADEKINHTAEVLSEKEEKLQDDFNDGVNEAKRKIKEFEGSIKNNLSK